MPPRCAGELCGRVVRVRCVGLCGKLCGPFFHPILKNIEFYCFFIVFCMISVMFDVSRGSLWIRTLQTSMLFCRSALFFVAFPQIQFETQSTKIDNFSDLLIWVAFLSFEFKQVYLNPQAAMFFFHDGIDF